MPVTITGIPVEGTVLDAFYTLSPDVPPSEPPRFFEGFEWRFVILDRASFAVLTFLDKIAINRTLYYELNQAAYATGDVASDNPEVNILHTDGDPFLSYNDRFLIGLRREGPNSPRPAYLDASSPWVPRFAGLITQVQRQAQQDQPVSHYSAWDPLQYWDSRPVVNSQGILVGSQGIPYLGRPGQEVLLDLLGNAEAAHGPLYVDWGQVAGGAYYGGHIDTIDKIDVVIKGGQSLAAAVKQLTDPQWMDIVLTPIYDRNRPGIIAELSVYQKAGTNRNAAIFAWDKPSRSLSGIDLFHDGTGMANVGAVWMQTVNSYAAVQSDAPSKNFYGDWWVLTQLFASVSSTAGNIGLVQEEVLLQAQIILQRYGKNTLTIDPTPERSPILWEEYFLGDNVPVYASDRFGEAINPGITTAYGWSNLQRVQAIPITLTDDGVETVEKLLLTYTSPPAPVTPPALMTAFSTSTRTALTAHSQLLRPTSTGFTGPTSPTGTSLTTLFRPSVDRRTLPSATKIRSRRTGP